MTPTAAIPRLGWHWSEGRDGHPVWKTRHLDGSGFNRVDVKQGTTVSLLNTVKIEPCRNGFHYCPDLLDSLRYGTGTFLSRVRGGGTMVQAGDKVAAQSRTVIWWLDARDLIAKWTTTWHVRPGPFQLAMVHAAIVADTAQDTWKFAAEIKNLSGDTPCWDELFRGALHYDRAMRRTQAITAAKASGVWRPDNDDEARHYAAMGKDC
jgi:hypothetical protein